MTTQTPVQARSIWKDTERSYPQLRQAPRHSNRAAQANDENSGKEKSRSRVAQMMFENWP
jgi:hypothetical protein